MGEDMDRSSVPDDTPSAATVSPPRTSVHGCLGGDAVADLLLWKRPTFSLSALLCVSTVWFLFERAGYSFLSLVANVILSLVAILFFWAKSATLLNRPLPPLPNLEVSEEAIEKITCVVWTWINPVLAIGHDIAIERNFKRFLEVIVGLWLVSFIGSLFSFLSLVYTGVVIALTVPVLYDKYQDRVDKKVLAAHRFLLPYLTKIDNVVLSKIPISSIKQKKKE
ncbi:reticulon-like protein B11 [Aristolochia californica]|uniref:reticulon-like protein B11 n=1 Tax=Aristolochia californica TaxID=171875 RepID=UPI0035DED2F9